jgi:hypothetical protein
MKNITLCLTVFILIAVSSQANAQITTKELRKEVKVLNENGIKTLTIETTEDGKTNSEIYTGTEADKKITEIEKQKTGTTKTMVIGNDGKQHLKVEKKIVISESIEIED